MWEGAGKHKSFYFSDDVIRKNGPWLGGWKCVSYRFLSFPRQFHELTTLDKKWQEPSKKLIWDAAIDSACV